MMRKGLILCFVGLLGVMLNAQETDAVTVHTLNWQPDYHKAKEQAQTSDKPILIFFTGSDWCGPCKMLVADLFHSDNFKKNIAPDFVLYEADFPRNRDLLTKQQVKDNHRLKNRYSVGTYPTVVVVNAKGKKLGLMKGYNLVRDTRYHYSFLEAALDKFKKSAR